MKRQWAVSACIAGLLLAVYAETVDSVQTTEVVEESDEGSGEAVIPTECPKVDAVGRTVLLAHESDCTKFYVCSSGRKIVMQCALMDGHGNRLYFNVKTQMCDWPSSSGCTNKNSTGEPAGINTTHAPTEGPTTSEEPTDKPTTESTTTGDSGEAVIPTECPQVDPAGNAVLLAHESDCTKFYACSKGQKILMQCALMDGHGNHLYFNVKTQMCDWPSNSGCTNKNITDGMGGNMTSTERPTTAGDDTHQPTTDGIIHSSTVQPTTPEHEGTTGSTTDPVTGGPTSETPTQKPITEGTTYAGSEEPITTESPTHKPTTEDTTHLTELPITSDSIQTTEETKNPGTDLPITTEDPTQKPIHPSSEPSTTPAYEATTEGSTHSETELPEMTENPTQESTTEGTTHPSTEWPGTTENPTEGTTHPPTEWPETTEDPTREPTTEGTTHPPTEWPETTENPTEGTTHPPTEWPETTEDPTQEPTTEGTTHPPTEWPGTTENPTEGTTHPPTEWPETTEDPTQEPTTEGTTHPPTEWPGTTENPTEGTTHPPTEWPGTTENPTEGTTHPPTEWPGTTENPTEGTTHPPTVWPETTENPTQEPTTEGTTHPPTEWPKTTENPTEGTTHSPTEWPETTDDPTREPTTEGTTHPPTEWPETTENPIEGTTHPPTEWPGTTENPTEGTTYPPTEWPETTENPTNELTTESVTHPSTERPTTTEGVTHESTTEETTQSPPEEPTTTENPTTIEVTTQSFTERPTVTEGSIHEPSEPSTTRTPETSTAVLPTKPPDSTNPAILDLCPANGSKNKEFYPHECICEKYYICSEAGLVLHQCLNHTHFNPKINACDKPENAGCLTPSVTLPPPTTPAIPTECPDSDPAVPVQLAHPRNCSLYYRCIKGERVLKSCSTGLHFNPQIQLCDWPESAGCTAKEETTPIPPVTSPLPKPAECPADGNRTLIPHETTCSMFYICDKGQKKLASCVPGLEFNPVLRVCDSPVASGCSTSFGSVNSEFIILSDNLNARISDESDPSSQESGELRRHSSHNHESNDDSRQCIGKCPQRNPTEAVLLQHRDCNKFCRCHAGKAYVLKCPSKTYYNPVEQICDYPQNSSCKG